AGTIAADGKLVGVAYGVKVLAIKAIDSKGAAPVDLVAAGIDAAVAAGAKVINLSLGMTQDSNALDDAILQAVNAGVLCVASAGNDGNTEDFYPAEDPGVLAVGSVGTSDARSTFSNYGSYVQMAAPGENILSSYKGGGYQAMDGTSMAAPHVTGAAALLLSRYPQLTFDQLTEALTQGGDPTRGFTQSTVTRLDVKKALDLAGQFMAAASPSATQGDPISAPSPATAPFSLSNVQIVSRSSTGAVIRWHTDVPSQGTVYYGDTTSYGAGSAAESSYATDHSLSLTSLRRFHSYHFEIVATSQDGQQVDSGDQTFRTKLWWIFSLSQSGS
ncbi:MAG: S8 family serine peptidase, partial [Cyanobacteria bacterium REEB65]|nr:S8 family serine peptidase [Cyanobacteria bacterium REEB65]